MVDKRDIICYIVYITRKNTMYTNYLLSNLPTLLNTEVFEDDSVGFLGVKFCWGGSEFWAHVDGHKVSVGLMGSKCRWRGLKKSIFTVGKKKETNEKHREELKKFLTVLLVQGGKIQMMP